ncbi:MAG: hypothetical protein Q7S10_03860 [bacterium]|nr:hypothetical protein [bacterium]
MEFVMTIAQLSERQVVAIEEIGHMSGLDHGVRERAIARVKRAYDPTQVGNILRTARAINKRNEADAAVRQNKQPKVGVMYRTAE